MDTRTLPDGRILQYEVLPDRLAAAPYSLWHGREDLMVPVSEGEWLAEHLPDATVHFEDGEGHMPICVNAFDRIVAELVERL